MSCFPCFQSQKSKKLSESKKMSSSDEANVTRGNGKYQTSQVENGNIKAQNFTFRELASATKNFKQECLLGEGGFGKVYKGMLHPSGQVVAVKQLDRNGLQENNIQTFMSEISTVGILQHPNLVNLIGYCVDGDQRLLVYEYMPGGSVEAHLLDKQPEQKALDWKTRMKIAYGAAQGLEYLHDKVNPAVVYHGLKPSNILMDEEFNPKLSDFGLAKLNPCGEKNHVSLITYGYSAPEYGRNGTLTTKSDVYSYGVVLLELITGRRAVDTTKPVHEQNLVAWAQPMLRDPKRFPDMADPHLNKQFPEKSLNQAVAIAAMCVQEEPTARPLMSDVVTALSFLTVVEDAPSPIMPPVMSEELNKKNTDNDDSESSDDEDDEEDGDSVYEDGMSEEGGGDGKSKKWGSKSSHKSTSKEGSHSSKGSLKKKTKKYFSLSRKSSKASSDHHHQDGSSVFSLSKKKKSRGKKGEDEEASLSSISRNSSRSSHSSGKVSLSRTMSKASHK